MNDTLRGLWAFWRRPANARYILLVIAAAFFAMLCHWDVRHNAASRYFAFTNDLLKSEWRSLARNEAGAIAGALVVWTVVAVAAARRRRLPLETALARTAVCFAPGLLAAWGVATNLLGCDKDLAKSIEILSLAPVAVLLWIQLDPRPLRPADGEPHRARFYAVVLGLAIAVYAGLFAWLSIARYMTYHAALNDLGMYTQQLWGNLHGHWFLCTTYAKGLPVDSMLAEHFMPLVLLLTPFYALWPDPRTLLIVQALAAALAALPLYGIAVRVGLDRRAGLLLAGSYLLHPLVQTATLYDFHPDAFVPLFGAGSFWALLELDHRLRSRGAGGAAAGPFPWRFLVAYALLVVLWLSYKEDSMFGVALLGFYALAFRRRWLLGLATIAVGFAWGAVAMGWIIPHFRDTAYSHVDRYYHLLEPFGWTPEDGSFFMAFLKTALLHPFHMLGQILDAPRIAALFKLFGPVLFLSFFGPKELLIAAPALAFNLLSAGRGQYEFRLHYPFGMMPFVYVSALVGLRNVAGWVSRAGPREAGESQQGEVLRLPRRGVQIALAAAAFLAALWFCGWFGETPFSRAFAEEKVWRTDRHRRVDRFLEAVPADASVSAQTGLAAHLTHRREIFEFPYLERDPGYVVLDARMHPWPLSRAEYLECVTELLEEGTYGVVETDDGLVLLRRGHSTERNEDALAMIERVF